MAGKRRTLAGHKHACVLHPAAGVALCCRQVATQHACRLLGPARTRHMVGCCCTFGRCADPPPGHTYPGTLQPTRGSQFVSLYSSGRSFALLLRLGPWRMRLPLPATAVPACPGPKSAPQCEDWLLTIPAAAAAAPTAMPWALAGRCWHLARAAATAACQPGLLLRLRLLSGGPGSDAGRSLSV